MVTSMEYLGLWGKMKISIPFKNTLRALNQWGILVLFSSAGLWVSYLQLPEAAFQRENQITSVISFNTE